MNALLRIAFFPVAIGLWILGWTMANTVELDLQNPQIEDMVDEVIYP